MTDNQRKAFYWVTAYLWIPAMAAFLVGAWVLL